MEEEEEEEVHMSGMYQEIPVIVVCQTRFCLPAFSQTEGI
jgi:hypothetical protein